MAPQSNSADPVVVHVDRERCMGSGNCSFHAPATFDLDDDMKAVVVDPAGDPIEKVRLAVEACPTLALRIEAGAH